MSGRIKRKSLVVNKIKIKFDESEPNNVEVCFVPFAKFFFKNSESERECYVQQCHQFRTTEFTQNTNLLIVLRNYTLQKLYTIS